MQEQSLQVNLNFMFRTKVILLNRILSGFTTWKKLFLEKILKMKNYINDRPLQTGCGRLAELSPCFTETLIVIGNSENAGQRSLLPTSSEREATRQPMLFERLIVISGSRSCEWGPSSKERNKARPSLFGDADSNSGPEMLSRGPPSRPPPKRRPPEHSPCFSERLQ